jgi:hypothetical protein
LNTLLIALGTYLAGLALVTWINRTEFARSPHKAARYKRLPLYYKAICPLFVVPSFSALPLLLYEYGYSGTAIFVFIVLTPVSMLVAEIAAVRWYTRNGLL